MSRILTTKHGKLVVEGQRDERSGTVGGEMRDSDTLTE